MLGVGHADLLRSDEAAKIAKDGASVLEAQHAPSPACRGASEHDGSPSKDVVGGKPGVDPSQSRHPVERILQIGRDVGVVFWRRDDQRFRPGESRPDVYNAL